MFKIILNERDDFEIVLGNCVMQYIFSKNGKKIFSLLGVLLIVGSVSLSTSVNSYADDGLEDIDLGKAQDSARRAALVGAAVGGALEGAPGAIMGGAAGGATAFLGSIIEDIAGPPSGDNGYPYPLMIMQK